MGRIVDLRAILRRKVTMRLKDVTGCWREVGMVVELRPKGLVIRLPYQENFVFLRWNEILDRADPPGWLPGMAEGNVRLYFSRGWVRR